MTWGTLLSGSGSNEFSAFLADHPNPVGELVNSRLLPNWFIDVSANLAQIAEMVTYLVLAVAVLSIISLVLYNLCIPLLRIIAMRW